MKGISLRKARTLAPADAAPADLRPAQIDKMVQVSADLVDAIRDVFAGTDLPDSPERVRLLLEARREVNAAWGSAKQAFIEIGRALNALDEVLHTKAERDALQEGFARLFPFSAPVASQFKRVAEMIDSGRVPIEDCPGSYSAAYQLALMPPEQVRVARQRGLVSQSATRSQIMALRKELAKRSLSTVNLADLMAEQRRLREARRKTIRELIQMRRRLQEIARILENDEKG
ncbi:hypothetical protein [Teichococcus aestuarii]|uniref:Uncharacterized protein n=1 Tax=Teichococcus aestuarii TaxID=568898 RepID=A0A2U1UYA0_9PROT|nr:hypothetical protein [Pseudoroseomonas aestuarii]PWC26620.1 hypothetical protein CR165_22295 [Pseudoroseomonas aestuarii]